MQYSEREYIGLSPDIVRFTDFKLFFIAKDVWIMQNLDIIFTMTIF